MNSCKKELGGEPKCSLGTTCKYVQINGISGDSLYKNNGINLGPFDVMIIGNVVNRDDEFKGKPFQGNLGQVMQNVLDKSLLDLSKVYLTNTVRCNPPKKKKATAKEREACLPYLMDEIKTIKPKVIVAMGNEAAMAVGIRGYGGINKIRGQFYDIDIEGTVYKVFPIINPASILARPSQRTEFRTIVDLQEVAVYVGHTYRQKNNPANIEYSVVEDIVNIGLMFDEIEKHGSFAFDTESPSYEWWKYPCIMAQFSIGKTKNYIVPFFKHDPDSTGEFKLKLGVSEGSLEYFKLRLKTLLKNKSIKAIGHNIKYDLHVLCNILEYEDLREINCDLIDTCILAWVIDSHSLLDLEYLGSVELGYPNYTHAIDEIVGSGREKVKTYDNIPDNIFYPYAATDAEITYCLYEKYWNTIVNNTHLYSYYSQESQKLIDVLFDAERAGFPYSNVSFENMYSQEKQKIEDRNNELQALAASVLQQDALPVNFNSPQQVANFLIALGYEQDIADETKASGYTTGKDIISELSESDARLLALSDYRKARKFVNSYLEDFPKMSGSDHRIHASYKIPGTTSGRLSARLMHQIARTDKKAVARGEIVFRQLFTALDGYSLVYSDYSQLELRMLAVASGDKGLIDLFEQGKDIHLRMTATILGVPETEPGPVMAHSHKNMGLCTEHCKVVYAEAEPNRSDIGKRVNFGLAYGSEGHKLVDTAYWKDVDGIEHPVTWMMLNEGMARWKQDFPLAAEFKLICTSEARKNDGWTVTEFGRTRYFSDLVSNFNNPMFRKAERDLVNHRIQSPSASILNRSLIMMYDIKKDMVAKNEIQWDDFYLVSSVHDSCTFMVRDELVPWCKSVLMSIMERPIKQFNGKKFKADIGVGKTWYEAEKNSK